MSAYDRPPEDTEAQQYARDLEIRAERDRYEVALRKIAAWKGYSPMTGGPFKNGLTNYETGANDMLATLAGFANEALA